MAILKHISVHNSNYSAAVLYFMYQHDNHARPIYDEAGLMIERENLLIDGINTTPYEYSYDCKDISRKYGKNRTKDEVKSHHWIISFDPRDVTERGLTVEKAHQLGMEFAAKHFGGFHCIVATHQDGNNGSGNIHCHIAHCSVRCKDVPQPPYSNLERDSKAGFKLHITKKCLHYLKEQTMLLCLQNGLTQIELNKPGQKNITDREYWAGKRGQERQDKAAESLSTEAPQKPTKFQTAMEKLRAEVESARDHSTSVEQFKTIMEQEHHVKVKESRGRWSYLPEGRERAITWRKLGEAYKKESIEAAIAANLQREMQREERQAQADQRFVLGPLPTQEEMHSSAPQNQHEAPKQPQHILTPQAHGIPQPDEDFFLYGRIIDLNSPKVQESYSLLQWSKIQNLKENARRFAYLSENGLLNVDRLGDELAQTRKALYQKQSQQVAVENRLKEVNELLRAIMQYHKTKDVYTEYDSIKNPRKRQKFYNQNETELRLNQAAIYQIAKYRKEHRIDQVPSIPALKKEKAALLKEQERLNNQRKALKESVKGMSEAYRAIEEQARQQQRSRQQKRGRDGIDLS